MQAQYRPLNWTIVFVPVYGRIRRNGFIVEALSIKNNSWRFALSALIGSFLLDLQRHRP